ncbi:hypothetical protein Pcinc_024083 [Petrolisthes cinctipes]|uniref:Uncharacterized protein n=1 Tax=Petrolisthes cinctipes TaxID=88211 RepID=A0AAE1FB27_PETCI|nr:hypothetical protein Pcinc_024083 [Petrolisthes cinctipes]
MNTSADITIYKMESVDINIGHFKTERKKRELEKSNPPKPNISDAKLNQHEVEVEPCGSEGSPPTESSVISKQLVQLHHALLLHCERYFRQYSQRITTNVRGIVKWKSLVGSGAVWALLATSAFSSFGYFTFTLHQPLFLRDVFGLSIDQNGVMSSILWVLELPVSLGVGIVVDALRRNRASLTLTKKICNTIG